MSNVKTKHGEELFDETIICSFITLVLVKRYYLEIMVPIFIILLIVGELFILANIQWAIPSKYYDSNNACNGA